MKRKFFLIIPLAAFGLSLLSSSCTEAADETVNKSCLTGQDNQLVTDQGTNCDFTAQLTDQEITDLLHMREEEKVARDVYLKFYEMYNMPIFNNIAQSEQRHMDAVLNLLNGYGLADPVAGMGAGEFTPAFQSLYNDLVAKGNTLIGAYEVGVQIEELDIADLEVCISSTEVQNIITVYNNLLAGSGNHLKAFNSKL